MDSIQYIENFNYEFFYLDISKKEFIIQKEIESPKLDCICPECKKIISIDNFEYNFILKIVQFIS